MLIYHPAFDAYHCVFRMLALAVALKEAEIDLLRICDFYLTFPSAIASVRLPNGLAHGRKIAKAAANIYRDPINPKNVFRDMAEIQTSALRNIAASGFIDLDLFEKGKLKIITSNAIPEQIKEKISNFEITSGETFEFLVKELSAIPLQGINGLKHRTDLLEYRYDIN
ncbi:ABC-three component system middle component 5 [Pseudomonas sp. Marseille-P9899]|uniref:ABC-three component system middle component 5 n=1 Tax=Pseudomonas sp. Marseille-P9899 TaxID=2730401 RepID=UPI00158A4525|nr:ABC-three component system middle component 5 [Pseudomonas sp. Marseille-P9899]